MDVPSYPCVIRFSRHKMLDMGKRKKLSLNQKNKGAAIEKPLFVDQGCLGMMTIAPNNSQHVDTFAVKNSKLNF